MKWSIINSSIKLFSFFSNSRKARKLCSTRVDDNYHCHDFSYQSCLIHFSKKCLFFTEGDFRSHNYIPPFFGKDVFSVAPSSVFALGTSPIKLWNDNVFKFGGNIIPITSEQINNKISINKIVNQLITN